jgi:hypothetical protein
MIGLILRRGAAVVLSGGGAGLALAQDLGLQHSMAFEMLGLAALAVMLVLGIVGTALWHDRSKDRQRLAAIERLVASGQPVPREFITGEKPPLPLPEERRRDVRRGITLLAWAIAVTLIPVIGSGGEWRYGIWGLLFLLPSLGSFFKAWLTSREIARGGSSGSPQA